MENLDWKEYIAYAWENLWFLRPEWLYAFYGIGVLVLLMGINYRRKARWKRQFDPTLLPFLTIKGTQRQFIWPRLWMLFLLSCFTLALAGPTWEQLERPGQKTEAALVVVMDLSRSMLAEDIQPNRIERAKLKLRDFFEAKPQSKTALIAYAGTAHSVVPFSKDYKTIVRQMDALRPDIMPIQGSNLAEALDLADSLLVPIQAPSTILVVTDNIRGDQIQRIGQTATHTHVEIMAIGTPSGGTIPVRNTVLKDAEGNSVIPRLEVSNLEALKAMEQVNVLTVTLDDSDVQILAARIRQNLEFIIDLDNAEEQWRDMGYWLLLPCLLITLLWFRRGWKVHWLWLLVLTMGCNDENQLDLSEAFYTKDQHGQRLLERGDTLQAAATFESGMQQGYWYYKAGDLEAAAQAYSQDVSAQGFYNLGVVYAEMGDLQAAQQAFNSALELDPDLRQARVNLSSAQRTLDSIAMASGKPVHESDDASSQPEEFQDYTESPDEKDSAQESDETYEGEGDIQEMVSEEVDENTIDIFEFDENAVMDKDAAKQTLLRQVSEDPSLFLRRKFAYQNKNRTKPIVKSDEAW